MFQQGSQSYAGKGCQGFSIWRRLLAEASPNGCDNSAVLVVVVIASLAVLRRGRTGDAHKRNMLNALGP